MKSPIAPNDLVTPGARFHKPASTFRKLFGGSGITPAQTLSVSGADGRKVHFVHNGRPGEMAREDFLRLAKTTLSAGAAFTPAA